jgi:branched-chain amino acid transport system ATP-binding protein
LNLLRLVLELKNITFGFSIEKQILKNISITLEDKQVYALMGGNGAGKTTLFNLISGFLKPQCGKIFFQGESITGLEPYLINRKGIGRTFQDVRLITRLSVKENIILAMHQNPSDKWNNALLPGVLFKSIAKKLDHKANEIAELFFLIDVINSLASDISFGQQKLLSLACCVANNASILLIDEAVAGVQPMYRDKIAFLIKQLKEQGKIILLVEHNSDFIENVADKIFFLHEGIIKTFKTIEELKEDQSVMKAYI